MIKIKKEILINNIKEFKTKMPYKEFPYSKKNWGHKLHSLCSYQGKLKPAIAHWLIKLFTEEGDRVLDPLGGVGTIPFEACLQGRFGITNDISIFAATVGAAKMKIPKRDMVWSEFNNLINSLTEIELTEDDFRSAEFGLNANVNEYFHYETLMELLKIKKYLMKNWKWDDAQNFIRANLLHILHGNRPYALSRKSHSLTPFKPSGEFEYKSVEEKLKERLLKTLDYKYSDNFAQGEYYFGSFKELTNKIDEKVDVIITSPPFVGMRFDRPNWLRLWLCGWKKDDFLEKSLNSLDRQQAKSWNVYDEFFNICEILLKEKGLLILHLGGSDKYDMVSELVHQSKNYFDLIEIVTEDVSDAEKHGVKDKGTTNSHKYIFLTKKSK